MWGCEGGMCWGMRRQQGKGELYKTKRALSVQFLTSN